MASLPMGKTAFKKFFKVSMLCVKKQNQTNVCIGCHILSNRTWSNIKFKSAENHLLNWLKKEKIFIDLDSLGIKCPTTIGHFAQIATDITHLANFRDHLVNQLMLIDIEAEAVIVLAPHLKVAQLKAMSNGKEYIPILPKFELYQMQLSHGHAPSQIATNVIGIKCEPRDAKLLTKSFMRLASETSGNHCDGNFLPQGLSNLLGPETHVHVLKDNNFFLSNVAMIPVNLLYNAWFAVINPNSSSKTDPISLHNHLLCKLWFLQIELVTQTKCLLVTTCPNLLEAQAWIDENLEPMVRKLIPPGIDPPLALLPRRLDKPTFLTASQTYANIFKKHFSLTLTQPATATDNN